jgi:predicted kinase
MSKMTIMVGLPASGKSTKAKELLGDGNTVRINKDLLRTMLHCDKFTGRNEEKTQKAAKLLAEYFLKNGTNVIIDDTNLNPGTLQTWKDLANTNNVKIEYNKLLDVPVEECITRDYCRDKMVGKTVIQKMAWQYLDYMAGEPVVICDLDGTLCNCDHRRHFVQGDKKDWRGFFAGIKEDTPNHDVIEQLLMYMGEPAKIIFVSARPEDHRTVTEEWLNVHFPYHYDGLIMRPSNDGRPDIEVKNDIYEKYLSKLKILAVFDDRPSVIRMWQSKGLLVLNCGDGQEF